MKQKKFNQSLSLAPQDMDRLLTLTEAADWLRMARRTLVNNVRLKRIPAVRINKTVILIHPRTVLAALSDPIKK